MNLIQRKTALRILKRYNKPIPKKMDGETQTEEAIDNKWKVMLEEQKSRLKGKIRKVKDILSEKNSEISKLSVDLNYLTRNYATLNEQYRA